MFPDKASLSSKYAVGQKLLPAFAGKGWPSPEISEALRLYRPGGITLFRALNIDNSTAERLAEYLAARLANALRSRGAANLTSVAVTVEEAPGQSASYVLATGSGDTR